MKVRERNAHVWWIRAFFLLVALPILGITPYIGVVNNPNENVRTYMTMAIVDDHTMQLDKVLKRFIWVNDMAKVPGKGAPDRHYSVKGPAMSFAGVPVYWAFRKVAIWLGHPAPSTTWQAADRNWWLRSVTYTLRFFTTQIPCFLFLVWFERYLRTVSSDVSLRLSAVAAAGLGTNYLAYATAFVSHTLFGVAAFLCFALTEMELRRLPRRRSWTRAFWAGFFCGLATLLEYQALPVSVLLALFGACAFYRPSRLVAFGVGGAINALAMMYFQWRCFGSPFMPGHKLCETPQFADNFSKGMFNITLPAWEPFKELSVDIGFGFFGTSPYMWLGLLAIPFALFTTFGPARVQRIRKLGTGLWLFSMLILWLALSGALNWRGGWTVGPRYLGVAPPFFAYGAVCALEKLARGGILARSISRGVAAGLATASVLAIGLVSIVYNTLPPSLVRPLTEFALPLARAGFVAHHALEWFGWQSTTFWYMAATALLVAPLLPLLYRSKESSLAFGCQIAAAVVAFTAGIAPQFTNHAKGQPPGRFDLRPFVNMWEPPERDKLNALRNEAGRYGPRRPCLWHRLADVELMLNLGPEAVQDRERAGIPRQECPRSPLVL